MLTSINAPPLRSESRHHPIPNASHNSLDGYYTPAPWSNLVEFGLKVASVSSG